MGTLRADAFLPVAVLSSFIQVGPLERTELRRGQLLLRFVNEAPDMGLPPRRVGLFWPRRVRSMGQAGDG